MKTRNGGSPGSAPLVGWFSGLLSGSWSRIAILACALLASPALAYINWFDTTRAERAASGYPIYNRTDVGWAHANRSAEAVCLRRGYDGGLYTGHQAGELMGINCFAGGSSVWMHLPGSVVRAQPSWDPTKKLEGQRPDRANHVGHTLCLDRGYETGFLNGHHDPATDLYGVVCIPREHTSDEVTVSNLAFSGKPWWWYRIVVEDACLPLGYRTGNILYFFAGSSALIRCYR
jgi:hypothetical protein